MEDYEGGRYAVTFADDNVSHLEYVWGDGNAVPLDIARSQTKSLIPSDSKLVRTYTPREARLGDRHFSESLNTPEQNGLIERFFRSLKDECVWQYNFESFQQASEKVGSWIRWYNQEGPHQALGYQSPMQFRLKRLLVA